MCKFKKLPQNEFEIMKAIWESEQPVTSNLLMQKVGTSKNWKIQTLISHLNRLVDKDFLASAKEGNERRYTAIIDKDRYLMQETENFLNLYHNNSLVSFLGYFSKSDNLTKEEAEKLINLLDTMEEKGK